MISSKCIMFFVCFYFLFMFVFIIFSLFLCVFVSFLCFRQYKVDEANQNGKGLRSHKLRHFPYKNSEENTTWTCPITRVVFPPLSILHTSNMRLTRPAVLSNMVRVSTSDIYEFLISWLSLWPFGMCSLHFFYD